MKIRVRYRNGRLQVVDSEETEVQIEDPYGLDLERINWSALGVDPIRSMIRGGYETAKPSRSVKK